jgi:glucuronate isomerase
LHAAWVHLSELGIPDRTGGVPTAGRREVWRTFSAHWRLYAGTASGYWLQHAFVEQFGITEQPGPDNADALFDRIEAMLATDAFRPRALLDQFKIEVLATTDDPMDDLAKHAALAADPTVTGRVLPTFRPDAYLNPAAPGFASNVQKLADWNGTPASSYQGYIDALAGRRRHFVDHGAVSADHGLFQPLAVDLSPGATRARSLVSA